jgi:ferredoxin
MKGMENTNPMTVREKVKFKTPIPTPIPDPLPCLAYIGSEETMRLACMTRVEGDVEVETGPPIDLFGENFFS